MRRPGDGRQALWLVGGALNAVLLLALTWTAARPRDCDGGGTAAGGGGLPHVLRQQQQGAASGAVAGPRPRAIPPTIHQVLVLANHWRKPEGDVRPGSLQIEGFNVMVPGYMQTWYDAHRVGEVGHWWGGRIEGWWWSVGGVGGCGGAPCEEQRRAGRSTRAGRHPSRPHLPPPPPSPPPHDAARV